MNYFSCLYKRSLLEDLKRLEEELIGDQEFLTDGEKTSSELYNKKLDQGNVEGYKHLLKLNAAFVKAISNITWLVS